jgi:glutamate 5-kinase
MAETSEEMAEAGVALAAKGVVEVADALETGQVAREIAKEGVKEVAEGAAEMGAAEVMEEVAEEMEKKSKS